MLVRITNKEKGTLEHFLEATYYFCGILKIRNMQCWYN